ncbi:hypothetical protein Plhal304r1_c057g0143561 [Plasmopara halstedii]
MLVPILSTLLLLDVSVSSTFNSSVVHQEDPVVFVRHLNDSLPSANSSVTVDEAELESYDKSEQNNTDTDETDGERGVVFRFKNFLSHNPYTQEAVVGPTTIERLSKLVAKFFKSNGEEAKFNLDAKKFADLLAHPATSTITQIYLIKYEVSPSKIFTYLMLQTQDQSLEEFFHLKLHIPLLSHVIKLIDKQGVSIDRNGVAEEIVRLFTANCNGGTLITWLGKIDDKSDQTIKSFMNSLMTSVMTSKLAYRLLSLRSTDFDDIHQILRGSNNIPKEKWELYLFNYAVYIHFNFIEHEAKSFSVVPYVHSVLRNHFKNNEEQLKQHLSAARASLSLVKENPGLYLVKRFSKDQLRLFKAALQFTDQTILVRKALQANRQASSFAKKLVGETAVATFKSMLENEELVQGLQAVLLDNEAVRLLKAIMREVNGVGDFSLLLTNLGAEMNSKEVEVVTKLDQLIKDEKTLELLKTSMVDASSVTMFKDALESEGRLKLVDDMLSSTELDSATILNGILDNKKRVQFLKEVLQDDTRLKLFRSALDDKIGVKMFKSALKDKKLVKGIDAVLKDKNQVFFLRVAVKDKGLANLFQAALEDKDTEHVENFLKALNEKKLANVFRSLLNEKFNVGWLETAVGTEGRKITRDLDKSERCMLLDEMIEYVDSLIKKRRQKG